MVLETGIFISQAIWLWRVRHVRREAKKAGMTYDEYIAQHPSKKLPSSASAETVVDVEACNTAPDTYSEKVAVQSAETLCTPALADTSSSAGPGKDSVQVPAEVVLKSG